MVEPQVIPTGIPNLDEVIGGGFPLYTTQVLAGGPGIGKTILAQQVAFSLAQRGGRTLYLTTVSEPTPKVIRFMQQFEFFDANAFGESVVFADVGQSLRDMPLSAGVEAIAALVERHQPDLLVVDSFRAIRDLRLGPDRPSRSDGTTSATSSGRDPRSDSFRLFCFDLSAQLSSARCTTILVGEYERDDVATGAEFSVADGILYLHMTDQYGERQRVLEVLKLRGGAINPRPHPFVISDRGLRLVADHGSVGLADTRSTVPVPTGIAGLDRLLGGGVPGGRAVLLSGQSGSGKTTLGVQFLMEGIRRGEPTLMLSVEESPERIRELALSFGWDLEAAERDGLLKLIHIPQTEVRVIEDADRLRRILREHRPRRLCLDSLSVFLHRIERPAIQREMAYRIVSLVRDAGAVGLLLSDVPVEDRSRLSRFGVEETVADGIITLSMSPSDYGHRRFLQVFKMRACRHATGRRRMTIGDRGVEVFTERPQRPPSDRPTPPCRIRPLQPLFDDRIPHGLVYLLSGGSGTGKTPLAHRFASEGLADGDSVLFVSAETGPETVKRSLAALRVDVDAAVSSGRLRLLGGDDAVSGRDPSLDPSDPEGVLYRIMRTVSEMPRPLRIVFDSLWPIAASLSPTQFAAFVRQKNNWLRSPDVTVVDTILEGIFDQKAERQVEGGYDIVLGLERVTQPLDHPERPAIGEEESTIETIASTGFRIRLRKSQPLNSNVEAIIWNPDLASPE